MEGETPPPSCLQQWPFRIVDVHLSDRHPILLSKQLFPLAGRDLDEAGPDREDEDLSLLEMSKLGLPTAFASASRRSDSSRRRHRKSFSHGRVAPSLISDDVSVQIHVPSGNVPMSVEDSVEDVFLRVPTNQANHSAAVSPVVSSLLSTDNDGICASSCQEFSLQGHTHEPVGKSVTQMSVLRLSRGPENCDTEILSDRSMVASAHAIVTSDENLSCDQVEILPNNGFAIPTCGMDSMNEAYTHSQVELAAVPNSASGEESTVSLDTVLCDLAEQLQWDHSKILNDKGSFSDEDCVLFAKDAPKQVADVGSITDSASNEQLGVQINKFPGGVTENTCNPEISHVSDAGSSGWLAYWDDYYCRYYFHNLETQESTWDPPPGFEAYKLASFLQSNDVNDVASSELAVTGLDSSTAHSENASAKASHCLIPGNSGVEAVSMSSVDDGVVERLAEDIVVELHQVLSNSQSGMGPSVEKVHSKDLVSSVQGTDPWSVCWDGHYGRYYFFNTESLESTWDPPKGFEAYDHDAGKGFMNFGSKGERLFLKKDQAEKDQEEASVMNGCNKDLSPEAETTVSCTSVTHEGSYVHADTQLNRKVAELSKRANRSAQYFLRLESQFEDATCSPIISKYWFQRFHLFSKYDLGIKLDEEGWFSVTPEAIARHQAARCCKGGVIIDAFCGVGGNAIQFALAGHHVVAIDNDARRIELAYHNAQIYGVADCIDFVLGDFFIVSSSMVSDVVFLSPPWGGPEYLDTEVYDVVTMLQPKDGITLLNVARSVAPNLILYLPRNADMLQLAEFPKRLSFSCSCEVENIFLNGRLKAITAYYGQFTNRCPSPAPSC